jgi:acyl carrier protein
VIWETRETIFTPDEEQAQPMGDYQVILNQLFEIIKPSVKDNRQLEEDTDLVADLGLDSLKVMTLVEEVEDRFDISIPLNILANVRTIRDFALQLQQLTEEG